MQKQSQQNKQKITPQQQLINKQKDPMLKELKKKIRDINKKLNQLQLQQDLKQQQQQYINKKQQINKEKVKYLQMISIYQSIIIQCQQYYQNIQNQYLSNIAEIIAIKEFGSNFGKNTNQQIKNCVKILNTPSTFDLTLQQRIQQIKSHIIQTITDTKLIKQIKDYIKQNPQKKAIKNIQLMSNKPEPISPRSQKDREDQIKQFQKIQQLQIKQRQCQIPQPLTPQIYINKNIGSKWKKQCNVLLGENVLLVTKQESVDNDQEKKNQEVVVVGEGDQHQIEAVSQKFQKKPKHQLQSTEQHLSKKSQHKLKTQQSRPRSLSKRSSESSTEQKKMPKQKKQQIKQLIQDGLKINNKNKYKVKQQQLLYQYQL